MRNTESTTKAGPTKTYGRTPSRNRPGRRSTDQFIAQKSRKTPPAPAAMATPASTKRLASASRRNAKVNHSSAMATIGTPPAAPRRSTAKPVALRASGGPWGSAPASGEGGGSCTVVVTRPPRRVRCSGYVGRGWPRVGTPPPVGVTWTGCRLLRPGALDLVEDGLGRVGAAGHVVPHPGPERPGAHLCGHEVGGVEATGVVLQRVGQDDRGVGELLVDVAVLPDVHVGRDAGRCAHAAHLALHLLGDEALEEVDHLGPGRVAPDHGQLAGVEDALLVDRGQREPVVVDARLGVLGEAGLRGDEAGLAVQPAPGRVLEHRSGRLAPGDRRRLVGPAEHVALGEHDLAERLGRGEHGRVVERDLVVDPLVVDIDPRGAEHDVLHPVGGRPAGRALGLEPDAPRRAAVLDDLIAEGDQVVPRLGHLVAGGVEVVLRVPDHALEVDVGGQAVVLAVDLAERHEALAERLVELVDVEAEILEGHDRACLDQIGDRSRLGHGRHVEGAALGADLELLLEVADRLDLDGVLGVRVDHVVEDRLVGVDLLRLAGAHQVDRARVLAEVAAASAAALLGIVTAAAFVIVVAACGEQHHDDGGHRHKSPESHRALLLWLLSYRWGVQSYASVGWITTGAPTRP